MRNDGGETETRSYFSHIGPVKQKTQTVHEGSSGFLFLLNFRRTCNLEVVLV
jgi:hypothetical protein